MQHYKRKTLAVVGAGPKGIAVAVKAKVFEEFGLPVDRVILIEKRDVAANWSGNYGYTNGEMKLGTSPEKDVVFPLETDVGDAHLNERIRQRLMHFTWNSFLVQTQRYSDWVDRGRPAPCHQLWALYLQWVSEQLAPQVELLKAEVTHIDLSENSKYWNLSLLGGEKLVADGLMLTGPGSSKYQVPFENQNLYDLESFWRALKDKTFVPTGRLAIVGAGENAASALLALAQKFSTLRVDVISPKGFVATRSENFYENQFYSQPDKNGWPKMELKDRIDFIERTDLGVFSVHAMTILNDQIRHKIVPGRVVHIEQSQFKLVLHVQYGGQATQHVYDQAVLATGFDYLSMLKAVLANGAARALEAATGAPLNQRNLALSIQSDLSVKGMTPALHLPMLAGLTQGPGFGNLSCLGRLSDRVLSHASRKAREQRLFLAEVSV